jgi:serine/threonine protein kinase
MNSPDEQVAQRFRNEARVAARVQSHHIARVHHLATLQRNRYYMVMEYLVGSDLEQFLKRRGALPASEAIDYVLQACEGLAAAHSLGIIHRDLKPANLIRTMRPDGDIEIKVLDFGLAKVSAELQGMERPGTAVVSLMGSPAYMSPEQARSTKNVDERTDIWALGVLLFEFVSGRLPFSGQGFELLMNITTEEPQALDAADLELPAGLKEIVARCLERDSSKRYGNLAELATDLASLGETESKHAARRIATLLGCVPGPSRLTALGAAASEEAVRIPAAPPRKSRERPSLVRSLLLGVIVLAVLAATAIAIVKARRYHRERSPGTVEPPSAPRERLSESRATPRPPSGREAAAGSGAASAPGGHGTLSSASNTEAEPTSKVAPAKAKTGTNSKDMAGPGKARRKSTAKVRKKGGKRRSR